MAKTKAPRKYSVQEIDQILDGEMNAPHFINLLIFFEYAVAFSGVSNTPI